MPSDAVGPLFNCSDPWALTDAEWHTFGREQLEDEMTTTGWSQCPYCRLQFETREDAAAHRCPKLAHDDEPE